MNLMNLPAGFHGNHPQYSKWIEKELNDIKRTHTSLPYSEVKDLIQRAQIEIGKAYDLWLKNGRDKAYNMNEYFRKLNAMQ